MSDTDKTGNQGVNFCSTAFTDSDWKFRKQPESDYGIDAFVETTKNGKPTGRHLALQIKTGPSYFSEPTNTGWKRRFGDRHRELWLNHSLTVVIILVDYEQKVGYWEIVSEDTIQKAKTRFYVEVPRDQKLDEKGFQKLQQLAIAEKPSSTRNLSGSGPDQIFETDDFQWLPSHTPDGLIHALYPKKGTTVDPSFQLRFEAGQEESLRDFYERGIGGEFQARILNSNFLPPAFISEDTIRVVASDRRLQGAFPVVFDWTGFDGYRFQREMTLHSTRAGSKEMVFESIVGQRDHLKLVFDQKRGQVEVNFTFRVAGSFAKRALETAQFFTSSMAGPGSVSIVLRDFEEQIFSKIWQQPEDQNTLNSCKLLEMYLELEKYRGQLLKVPEDWFKDRDVIGIIEVFNALTTGKLDLGNCELTVPVSYELSEKMKSELDGAGNLTFRNETSKRIVAGYEFELGPCMTVIHEPLVLKDKVPNHSFEIEEGVWAHPFAVNVPVRSKTGSVVQYFENFLPATKGKAT